MGNLTLFHYTEGDSLIHRHNAFLKLCEMIATVSFIAFSGTWSLLLFLVFLVSGIIYSGMGPVKLIRNLKMFWWLLAFIFIASLLSGGDFLTERLPAGARECLRFCDYILTGFLFTQTTSPDKLYGVIYALFRPIPFLPHRKIASFFLIIFTLLPKAVDTYAEVGESVSARGLGNSRRPLHRALYRIYPLMINMFLKADNFSDALTSRCFNSDAELQARDGVRGADFLLFLVFAGILLLCYSPVLFF